MTNVRVVAIAAAIACGSSVARAEPPPPNAPSPADRSALAEALFERGKALMAEHRYAEACPALAESQRLDAGGGTILALALCHEREGRTATAWAELRDALARAQQDGEKDRATVAKQHADALEPRLSRLVIRLDGVTADTPGLSVLRDGIALGRPAWDLPAPVDPGDHDVVVNAPARRAWSTRVRVGSEGDLVQVVVPPLEAIALPHETPPQLLATPPSRVPSDRRIAAISLAGISAVSLGIGIGFGVRALTMQSEANGPCPTSQCNDPTALQANAAARAAAWVAELALPGRGSWDREHRAFRHRAEAPDASERHVDLDRRPGSRLAPVHARDVLDRCLPPSGLTT